MITPVAVSVVMESPAVPAPSEIVTVYSSSVSATVSSFDETVKVLDKPSSFVKVTLPDAKAPPKSAASTPVPLATQLIVWSCSVTLARVIVKV